jgi:sodium-dependent dicarboxylate transporter 2/3/5
MGKHFLLTREAKGPIAVFLLAGTWWVFEVVPIGVLQALFLIRPARDAFTDFMVPAVMFIFASIMIGLVFTKTGLTRRLVYQMLVIVGEKPVQRKDKWGGSDENQFRFYFYYRLYIRYAQSLN